MSHSGNGFQSMMGTGQRVQGVCSCAFEFVSSRPVTPRPGLAPAWSAQSTHPDIPTIPAWRLLLLEQLHGCAFPSPSQGCRKAKPPRGAVCCEGSKGADLVPEGAFGRVWNVLPQLGSVPSTSQECQICWGVVKVLLPALVPGSESCLRARPDWELAWSKSSAFLIKLAETPCGIHMGSTRKSMR